MESIVRFVTEHVELSIGLGVALSLTLIISLTVIFKVYVTSNKNNITAGRDANVIKGIGNKIEKGSR